MYVEFIGLSGSGKTTAAKASMDLARAKGVKARNIYRYCSAIEHVPLQHWRKKMSRGDVIFHHHLKHLWEFSARFPKLSAELFAASKSTPNYQTDLGLFMANLMMLEKLGHDDVLVTADEGMLHRSVAAVSASGRLAEWEAVLNEVPMPDALVYMRVLPDEAARRASARRRTHTTPNGQTWEEFANLQIELFDALEDRATLAKVPVIRVGSSDTPDQIAEKSVALLAERVVPLRPSENNALHKA